MPTEEDSESESRLILFGLSKSLRSFTSRKGVDSLTREVSGVGLRDVGADSSLISSVDRGLALALGRNVHLVFGFK